MSKYFRPWNIDQTLLLPPSVQDFVPKGHVSRFIVELVRESLDLKEITGSYVSGLGQPPFDPRMMVALLLHGYASGLYSSRRIARACRERNDFVMIVALDPPDFRTISDFRKRHLKALGGLFLQVLKLCETAGLVKLGHVALDGTKIKANASKHKAMSYERMKKREAELQAEVARMLAAAEAADCEEDETFGKDKRIDAEEKTAGGIIIPDSAKEKPSQGEITAVGPGGRDEAGKLIPIDLKVGDRVLFGKWSGTEVKLDGEELLIMKESDIMGVLTDVPASKKKAA
jgi:co-chaperonin GroES (HSP10)/transposase